MTNAEFCLLPELARSLGALVTYRHLLDCAWDAEETDVKLVQEHICKIRGRIGQGDDVPRIVAECGLGYRMVEPEGGEAA